MNHLTIIDHPLVKRDLTTLRNAATPSNVFRSVLRRTASLMAYEVTKDLRLKTFNVRTPLERTKGYVVRDPIILIPILRAGLGLVGGFVEVIPDARVGHIGLYRDEETLKPVDYYLDYTIGETLRQLRPLWRKSIGGEGQAVANGDPASIRYLLRTLTVAELLKLPRTPEVAENILSRSGVSDAVRAEANDLSGSLGKDDRGRPTFRFCDPFVGSGTVVAVAQRLGRRGVGVDLSYQDLARERTAQRGLLHLAVDAVDPVDGIVTG